MLSDATGGVWPVALGAWRVIRKAAVALDLEATTSTLADSDSACKRRNTAPTSPASPAAHAASIAEEGASAREREVEHVHLLSALLLPRHRKLLRLPVRLLTIPCLLLQTRFSKLRHACRCRVVVHVHFARTPAAVGVQCALHGSGCAYRTRAGSAAAPCGRACVCGRMRVRWRVRWHRWQGLRLRGRTAAWCSATSFCASVSNWRRTESYLVSAPLCSTAPRPAVRNARMCTCARV